MDPCGARGGRAVAVTPGDDIRPDRRSLGVPDLLLIIEFALITFAFFIPRSLPALGIDAATYWAAANRWLGGQDPYADLGGGLIFAAPPPTLAVLAPFSLMPLPAFVAVLIVASLVAVVFILRRLRLPFWFLLFPPIVEALIVGNPNVIVVALLVAAVPATDAIATFLKGYAAIPVVLLDRRRSVIWILIAGLVTAPLLPWGTYLAHAAELVGVLNEQSAGGRSALAHPVLVPFTVAALFVLGRRRAAWLLVPALWPATQLHYSVLALPASTRLMAAILAVPLPGAPAIAVIAGAAAELHQRARNRRSRALVEVPSR